MDLQSSINSAILFIVNSLWMEDWENQGIISFWIWTGIAIFSLFTAFIFILLNRHFRRVRSEQNLAQKLVQNEKDKFIDKSIDIQESERQYLSEELHDNVVSQLNLIRLSNLKDPDQLEHNLQKSIKSVRELSRNLSPAHLDMILFTDLIQDYLEPIKEQFTIRFQFSPIIGEYLSQDKKLDLFRIFQEIITNLLKHNKASELLIYMRSSPQYTTLIIQDNGVYFSTIDIKNGTGLRNIELRTNRLNATYKYKSSDKGTRFIISLIN
jgi:signal transduction histidine kinase